MFQRDMMCHFIREPVWLKTSKLHKRNSRHKAKKKKKKPDNYFSIPSLFSALLGFYGYFK